MPALKAQAQLPQVDRSAMSGIVISSIMRYVLFLAVLGVVVQGVVLDVNNPPASVFRHAAGELGFRIFGVVLWSAAISSVVGAAYTSVSFFKTFHPVFVRHERLCISIFIILSTIIFVWIGKPKQLLIAAGMVNGLILPMGLAIILMAAMKTVPDEGIPAPRMDAALGLGRGDRDGHYGRQSHCG